MLELILSIASAFIAGYFVGEFVTILRTRSLILKLAAIAGIDIRQLIEEAKNNKDVKAVALRKLQVETHHDILYLFDSESDVFICQGSTIEDLAKQAKEHKNIIEALVTYGNKQFVFSNGESKGV
jgi:hypothetical protein